MSLDASFQDNSYLKNYLAYDMMEYMEVRHRFAVMRGSLWNGEEWGLFLAVEEPEDAFLRRNYGVNHGNLYKPDYRRWKRRTEDVALQYISEDPEDYDNIFRNAKTDIGRKDQERLIRSLQILSDGEDIEAAVNVDQVLRYFTVQCLS